METVVWVTVSRVATTMLVTLSSFFSQLLVLKLFLPGQLLLFMTGLNLLARLIGWRIT